jgi:branched-chain amino acid aminotransferase
MEQMGEAILETVKRNGLQSCYIRPLVFRGSDSFSLDARSCPTEVVIIAFEWGRYLGADAIERGVEVNVSSWRRIAPDTTPMMAKAGGNYLNAQFVAMEAKDYGFVEGIALDIQGYVGEGSGENIFVVHNGRIITPPVGASILMGITREYVITLAKEFGYEVREQLIPRELLYVADEVFFTGTAAEITPIRSVDRIEVGNGTRGPVTKRLQEEFFGIVSGDIPDRHGWMTVVK